MKVTILVATPEGVVEYSFEGVYAEFAVKNNWDKYAQSLTLRTPPPPTGFDLKVRSFDYVKGHGTSKMPDTPIYDRMMKEQFFKEVSDAQI